MGTFLGPKYIPYTYMDPLGSSLGARWKGLGVSFGPGVERYMGLGFRGFGQRVWRN